jgi:hypothetical protein
MTLIQRLLARRVTPILVFLALGNLCSPAQEARESCSSGLQIALSAEYAGPWVSGKASGVEFQYGLSSPESVSAAWIEIWDGRNRLFKQNVKVQGQGKLIWKGLTGVPETPSNLQIEIFDSELPLPCDNCSKKRETVSIVLAGTAPDEDPPFPSLASKSSRLVEGDSWVEIPLEGRLLGSQTEILLTEQDGGGLWLARQYLPVELVDLQHVRVQIPPGYLSRPAILGLNAERAGSEKEIGSDVGLPAQTLYVTNKDSPVLDSVEPSEVSADEAEKGAVTVHLHGSGFKSSSRVALSLENASDLEQGGLQPEFISANELRIDLPTQYFVIDGKWNAVRPVRLWVANDDVLHISEPQEIRISPSAHLPSYPSQALLPVITQISPYPVPLMEPGGPTSIPLTVQGTNFRRGQLVVAENDRDEEVKLKTLYVSPQELQAWLPSKTWSEHRLRFRLVVSTAAGTAAGLCATDVVEDY